LAKNARPAFLRNHEARRRPQADKKEKNIMARSLLNAINRRPWILVALAAATAEVRKDEN
jgi:hypothetical protein